MGVNRSDFIVSPTLNRRARRSLRRIRSDACRRSRGSSGCAFDRSWLRRGRNDESGGGMTALITAAALGPSKGARAMGGVGPLDPEPDANFGATGDVAAEREGWAGAWAGGGDTGRTGKTKELFSVLMGSAGFGMRGSLPREAVCLLGLGTIGCSRFRFTGARAGGSGAIGAITKLGRRTG